MEIRSILVNLDVDFFSPPIVQCASDLAKRFNADLIGVAASPLSQSYIGIDSGAAYATYYQQEREQIEARLRALEEEFRSFAGNSIKVDWYPFVEIPNQSMVSLAQRADLMITASHMGENNYPRSLNVGELVLTAGRPVIVVGSDIAKIRADKILIGWKNAREARRAVVDALPFLNTASEVVVATISEGNLLGEKAALQGVLSWLRRHDIKARGDVYPRQGTAGETLEQIGKEAGADLIVTGGYGHSRLREWFLGGMTSDLLANPTTNRFMSN